MKAKKNAVKAKPAKPIKRWAVISKDNRIRLNWIFDHGHSAIAQSSVGERIARVEIREI